MAKLISQSCGELQLAVCLPRGYGAIWRWPEHSWTSDKTSHSKSSQGNFQHQYLPELLVNVYSYRLMVKSVSCCCVRGRHLFSNLVTFQYICGQTARLYFIRFIVRKNSSNLLPTEYKKLPKHFRILWGIIALPNTLWNYCPTGDNPADLLTRGTTSATLSTSLWTSFLVIRSVWVATVEFNFDVASTNW